MTTDSVGGGARWWRVGWLAVAGFSAAVVVVAVGVPLSSRFTTQTVTTTWSATHAIGAVQVNVDSADVTVRPAATAAAESLRQTLTWSLNKPQVTETWQGDTLLIIEDCGSRTLFEGDSCGAALDLAVPAGIPVHVTADSGSVILRQMTGSVRAEVVSGDLELDSVAGDVWARAESGSINGNRLRSGHVEAQTESGDLTLGFAAPPDSVSCSAISGSVNVTVPPGTSYRVTGRTLSGERQIADGLVNDNSPRTMALDSESGDTDLGYALGQ